MVIFDSRDPRYRTPSGAVPAGAEVRFTVRPESYRFPLRGYLCVRYENSGEQTDYAMTHLGTEEQCELFTVSLSVGAQTGLVWYFFRFENEGGFFFYGKDKHSKSGKCAFFGSDTPEPYQLTIYDGEYSAPEWFGQGVCYHIFPDRFCRLAVPDEHLYSDRGRLIHKEWGDIPIYTPESNGKITNRDFFGGSIEGIRSKLEFLNDLGVTCIYLSPIFEAYSNHRYDTANYEVIDPLLGTAEQFSTLCSEASKLGIRILLDGVFNHTGFDSVYFNGTGRYPSIGAFQSQNSPYSSWYSFEKWPDKYDCWWGVKTLPHVNENDPGYADYIADSKNSIVRRWLRAGASGWRLDVADELPDQFIEKINRAARSEKSDALIIGEVWEDASNKISYGERRRYLLGNALDGTMNYPFRAAVIAFLCGGASADFRDEMETVFEHYPDYAIRSAMNILGTHDTPRILSVLDADYSLVPQDKDARAHHKMSSANRQRAITLLKLGSLIQFSFIGSPCVYYGDEAGMEGFEDPLNRRGYIWGQENSELVSWYKLLGRARKDQEAIRMGSIEFIDTQEEVIAFRRIYKEQEVIAVCNRSNKPGIVKLPVCCSEMTDFMTNDNMHGILAADEDEVCVNVELQPLRAYLLIQSKPSTEGNQ